MPQPLVSFVLATCERRDILHTMLEHLDHCGLGPSEYEVWIVDNGSTDGTIDYLRQLPEHIHIIELAGNEGACAKDHALAAVRGSYTVFLDDDSWPIHGSIPRMIERFEAWPALAAAGFAVHLPDGGQECAALPDIFVGCGVGLRTAALRAVGGLDRSLFMIAEEYDLCFRLVRAGHDIAVFDDLQVMHLKAPMTRDPGRRAYYDMRNNMILGWTYLPAPWHRAYLSDWTQRYRWIAERCDAEGLAHSAWCRGRRMGQHRRRTRPHARLRETDLRHLFCWAPIEAGMQQLKGDSAARSVIFADLGKNIFAYFRAARTCGLAIEAIADDGFAAAGRSYRGIPVMSTTTALALPADAVVVTNSSAVHAEHTARRISPATPLTVAHWPLRTGETGLQQPARLGI